MPLTGSLILFGRMLCVNERWRALAAQGNIEKPTYGAGLTRIHRRTPIDGVRKAEGGGEGATGEIAWVLFGVGRSADGLHRRTGAPMAVCGSCDARDGERIRNRELSRTGLARVCGDLPVVRWVGRSPTVPSGRE